MLTIIKAILNRGNVEYTYDVLQLSTKFTKYTLTAFCKVLFDVNTTLGGHLQYLQHISPNTADICKTNLVSYSYYHKTI